MRSEWEEEVSVNPETSSVSTGVSSGGFVRPVVLFENIAQ